MGEIKDFINLYIEDSGMIEEMMGDVTINLKANIQDELYPGHGYVRGDLHDSIQSDITSKNKLGGVIEAYSMIEYAPYVNDGHHNFEGYHFMEAGLDKTVAMYK